MSEFRFKLINKKARYYEAEVFIKGVCSGNQFNVNIGAYGVLLKIGDKIIEIKNSVNDTSNNQMELQGVIVGLKNIVKDNVDVTVYLSSAYVLDPIKDGRVYKWPKNGYVKKNGKQIMNKKLWVDLINQILRFSKIKFIKVKSKVNYDDKEKWYIYFKKKNVNYSYTEYLEIRKCFELAIDLANMTKLDYKYKW